MDRDEEKHSVSSTETETDRFVIFTHNMFWHAVVSCELLNTWMIRSCYILINDHELDVCHCEVNVLNVSLYIDA